MGLVLQFAINKSLFISSFHWTFLNPWVILIKSVISLGVEKWLFPKPIIICPTLIRACIFHNGELFPIIQGKLQSLLERQDKFLPFTLQCSECGPRGVTATEGVVSFLSFFKHYHCLKILYLFNILQSFIVIILFYGKQIINMIISLGEL